MEANREQQELAKGTWESGSSQSEAVAIVRRSCALFCDQNRLEVHNNLIFNSYLQSSIYDSSGSQSGKESLIAAAHSQRAVQLKT